MQIFDFGEYEMDFCNLKTRYDVADMLGIEEASLRYFLYKVRPDNMYMKFSIQKRNGGTREICAPNKKLKNIQRKLLKCLEDVYHVKPAVYGFVPGKCFVDNAQMHCRQKVVCNVDLKDFFRQIHFGRVKGMLVHKPYELGEEAAMVIAQLVCYQGYLPQGAPTSPVIANMVCAPLDTQLTKFAKKYHMRYSRYADDITFSSHRTEFPDALIRKKDVEVVLGEEFLDIMKTNSFTINYNKVYLRSENERQEVTGLIVNEFVNLRRSYLKNIRAILHNCECVGLPSTIVKYVEEENVNPIARSIVKQMQLEKDENKKYQLEQKAIEWFKHVLKGKIEFIKCVRGEQNGYFLKYARQLNKIYDEEIFDVTDKSDWRSQSKKWCYIIESTDHEVQGSGFLLKNYGIVTNYHVTEDDRFYQVKTVDNNQEIYITPDRDNLLCANKNIDYALYSDSKNLNKGWVLGDSDSLKIGSRVRLIGFPLYNEGDSQNVNEGHTTGRKKYMGQMAWTVSVSIVHGASGGVVLDENNEVVGVIRVGAQTFQEEENEILPAIIPINEIINDINCNRHHCTENNEGNMV